MSAVRRTISVIPALPVAAAAVVVTQVLRAAHRTDLPSFPNQDPSATLGEQGAPPLRVVALGDSSVTAPGVEDLDNCWVRRVARSLAAHYCVELISLAVGGAKARDVIEGQVAEATRLMPDVALVSVGANDALRGVSPKRYRVELRTILDRLEDAAASVVLFGMGDMGSIPRLPPTVRSWATRRSDVFDGIAAQAATESLRTVKVPTGGMVRSAFYDDQSLFSGDLFHASDAGHAIFAEAALPAVEAAIALSRVGTGGHRLPRE